MRRMYSESKLIKLIKEHGGGSGELTPEALAEILKGSEYINVDVSESGTEVDVRVDQDLLDLIGANTTAISNEVTRAEGAEATLTTAVAGKQDEIDTNNPLSALFVEVQDVFESTTNVKNALSTLNNGKQDKLTAGANITISNNVISAASGADTLVYDNKTYYYVATYAHQSLGNQKWYGCVDASSSGVERAVLRLINASKTTPLTFEVPTMAELNGKQATINSSNKLDGNYVQVGLKTAYQWFEEILQHVQDSQGNYYNIGQIKTTAEGKQNAITGSNPLSSTFVEVQDVFGGTLSAKQAFSTLNTRVPAGPSGIGTEGTYVLKCDVDASGNPTYSWVLESH